MDDPRNTDNAWLETTAVNYHDEEGSLLDNFVLRVSSIHGGLFEIQQISTPISHF